MSSFHPSREPTFWQALSDASERVGLSMRWEDGAVHVGRHGVDVRFHPIVQAVLRPSMVGGLQDLAAHSGLQHPPLVLAQHVSDAVAETLRSAGLAFLDTAGNAWLETPSWLVWVTGRKRVSQRLRARSPVRAAGLQVGFVLLRDPAASGLSVRALGACAGVSHGAAAAALNAFAAQGWIENRGRRGQRLLAPADFLSGWSMLAANDLLPKLEIGRATPLSTAKTLSGWAHEVVDAFGPELALVGGDLASELAQEAFRGPGAVLYVRSWNADTMRRLRLVPAREGTVVLRQAFAPEIHDPRDPRRVDPLLRYVEHCAHPDERAQVVRDGLRQQILDRVVG